MTDLTPRRLYSEGYRELGFMWFCSERYRELGFMWFYSEGYRELGFIWRDTGNGASCGYVWQNTGNGIFYFVPVSSSKQELGGGGVVIRIAESQFLFHYVS
jgi:hypothetical protein